MNVSRRLIEIIWRNKSFCILLLVSALVRVVIVLRGGQLYFPDSSRYTRAMELVALVVKGDWLGSLDLILETPAHIGFLLLASILAGIQQVIAWLFAQPIEHMLVLPSLFLASISVLCIILVAGIARRTGASEREAFVAALLMASSTSMFYFARHLVPYDLAMMFALFGLWIGVEERSTAARSFGCGLLAGLTFLTYNGYWLIAGVVILVHIFWNKPNLSLLFRRGIATGVGLLFLPAVIVMLSYGRGITTLSSMIEFAHSVNQGTFSEGWSLPWEYLWHAEHGLLGVWIVGAAMLVGRWFADRQGIDKRGLLWLGILAGIYAALTIGSTGTETFVVYGRLARQMIPFACLAAASNSDWLKQVISQRWLINIGAILLAAQVTFNFSAPLWQQFPIEIEQGVLANYQSVGRALTVKGPPVFGNLLTATHRYALVNAQTLYPISGTRTLPAGKTILHANHPLEFLPYQYEGHDPGERVLLRSVDLAIRLIELSPPN